MKKKTNLPIISFTTRTLLAALPVLLLLTGCASSKIVWQKQGASQQDFDKDQYACIQESRTTYTQFVGSGDAGADIAMTLLSASAAKKQSESLFNFCMQARGWTPLDLNAHPTTPPNPEPGDTAATRKALLEKFKETHPDFDQFRTEFIEACRMHPEWDNDINGLPKLYEAAKSLAMAKVESRAKELGLDQSELELCWELTSDAPNLPLDDRIKSAVALIRKTTWVGSWNNDKDGTYGDLTLVIKPTEESAEKLSGRIIIIYQSFRIGIPFHGDRIGFGKYRISGYRSIPDVNLSMTLDSIIEFNEETGVGGGTYRLRSDVKGNQHDDEGNFILGKKQFVER